VRNILESCIPLLGLDPLRRIKHELRQRLGLRNTFGDRIVISDEVLVWQGDRLLFRSKGHIVNQGLIDIVNLMTATNVAGASYGLPTGGSALNKKWSQKVQYMRVGTGTGVTTSAMSSLVTQTATAADSQSGATAMPALGTYRISWTATWNAGTLAAIDVSELGLFLCLDVTLRAFEIANMTVSDAQLFSRLSNSDGDFTTFTVNTAVPLVIEWRLTFTFA